MRRTVKSSMFSYNAQTKTFVGEMSNVRSFHRVYADACDQGFIMVSATTGKECEFVVDDMSYDAEGDLLYYILKPTSASLSKLPQMRGFRVKLFND